MATGSALRARRLDAGERPRIEALLDSDPVGNVYLRSELRSGSWTAPWWAVGDGDTLRAVVLSGSLAVPCIPDARDATALAEAIESGAAPRVIVGPRDAAVALHAALGRAARDLRDRQPLLTLRRGRLDSTDVPIRRAVRSDLDPLVVAAAAMHREEMGVDPLNVDPAWWRSRMATLVERGWSWVWMERGQVVFKAELSAWTPEAAQLQGVYTAPAHRRRGVASRSIAAICSELFARTEQVSLYANRDNDAALRLYAALGFERCGDYATVIY
ncbi:MAG: GNAT family N-acetyltransferase [Candidatus Dormibacteraeota bacterium]|nr:GNAT family N-acetyltransferase [Candidatus Dormibacteraeota bacterium]